MRLSTLLLTAALVQAGYAQSSRYPVQEKQTIQRSLEFAGSGNRMIELDNVSGSMAHSAVSAPMDATAGGLSAADGVSRDIASISISI
jgi:hypothetical protein